jgi:translation initiation factor 3 subunit C
MLLEIPFMAAHEYDHRRRVISKSFHYQLRLSDKQALVGPPESMREHIVAASKAMKTGDWKKCSQNILAVSCWELFPNAEKVKAMIMKKIQEESLRTYLFTYNKVYDSISMYELAEMFDLPWQMVHSIISKMIINEELQASWDQPTQSLVLHHGAEPTYLQSLTLQLSDKLNTLVEHHERILDFKYGPIFQKDKKERGEKGGQNRGQNRGPNANKGQYRNNQRRHHNKQQQQDM